MQIIPVIDLKQGQVVHARMGQRDNYEPIESILLGGSDPASIVGGLLGLHPFPVLYIADLDAIAGGARHDNVLENLKSKFPSLQLWVDSGISSADTGRTWLERGFGELVLGSESFADLEVLADITAAAPSSVILSLDFIGDRFHGPAELLSSPELWPSRIIAMTLGRVGSSDGPDLDRLADIIEKAGDRRQVFAAGGVRDVHDLRKLASTGVAGVLVASALHDGRLGSREIDEFQNSLSA